jgi:hypothetical protein
MRSPWPFSAFIEVRVGVENLRFPGKGASFNPAANQRARPIRSFRPAQRILTVFVQLLDFNTVEPLVANLQPGAKG